MRRKHQFKDSQCSQIGLPKKVKHLRWVQVLQTWELKLRTVGRFLKVLIRQHRDLSPVKEVPREAWYQQLHSMQPKTNLKHHHILFQIRQIQVWLVAKCLLGLEDLHPQTLTRLTSLRNIQHLSWWAGQVLKVMYHVCSRIRLLNEIPLQLLLR